MGEISTVRVIAVAAVALIALAVWLFRETGDPDPAHTEAPPHKPRTRYAELVAARREMERQMDDLRYGHGRYCDEYRAENLTHLRALHAEIEVQLDALRKQEDPRIAG